MSFPILTLLVLLPVVGSVLTSLISNRQPDLVKVTALLTSAATGGMSIWLLFAFKKGDAGFQFVSEHAWIRAWGISWHLGVDGISLFLVVLTGILFPLVIVGIDPHHDHKRYVSWLLLLEAGVMGSFVSLDLFLFFIFFEIVLVPMYFLIGGWGYDQRIYAATKFFLFTMAGSAFMLVGTIATAVIAKADDGKVTFDMVKIAEHASFATSTGRWLFFAFAIAFAVKVPLFPLHTWLPDAHTQAFGRPLAQSGQQHLLQIAAMDKPIRGTKSVSAILAQVKQFPALPRQAMAHLLAFGLAHDLAHGRLQTQVDQHPRAVG